MKFRKGGRVEVLNQRDVPYGSWLCAEIVSGNGHYYTVRYDHSAHSIGGEITRRVPRKSIRPCPPSVSCPKTWVPGDIVEVFNSGSWKLAEVSRIAGRHYFFVRLLGSSETFKAHSSNLRQRQSWQDNRWVIIGKDSRNSTGCILSRGDLSNEKNMCILEPESVSLRGMKRKLEEQEFCFYPIKIARITKKPRVAEKDAMHQQLITEKSYQLPGKVDAAISPQKMMGENYLHALAFNGIDCFDMGPGRENPGAYVPQSLVRNVEPDRSQSDTCSVASCSGSNYPEYNHVLTGRNLDLDNDTDAQSFCGSKSGREQFSEDKVNVAAEIHKMELHAYHSTMEALHASGPISWEQEALLTNLRLNLHISNDEHLLEIRNLACGPLLGAYKARLQRSKMKVLLSRNELIWFSTVYA